MMLLACSGVDVKVLKVLKRRGGTRGGEGRTSESTETTANLSSHRARQPHSKVSLGKATQGQWPPRRVTQAPAHGGAQPPEAGARHTQT